MILQIDRKIYSDSCISNVVYWLSNQFPVNRCLNGDIEALTIDGVKDEQGVLLTNQVFTISHNKEDCYAAADKVDAVGHPERVHA